MFIVTEYAALKEFTNSKDLMQAPLSLGPYSHKATDNSIQSPLFPLISAEDKNYVEEFAQIHTPWKVNLIITKSP